MADSRKTGNASTVEDMQRLRELILGAEKDRLHKLDHRVSDLELRTADVAEVLPGAMNRLVDDPVSQPDIEQPIVNTIRGAIKRDTHSFAEALFPVIGPAIRRAVADALKSLVQRINVAMENSFTAKGLRWRVEAARTGVPFAQIVLRHTMLFAIQEAFLIQRKSGLVLASVHRDKSLALDEDAVSSMLTAIQSFIQDSFGVANDEPLRSAELGDRTLWVINGPDAVLACIISGSPPRFVRDELMDLLETMHARFGDHFNEHPEALADNKGLSSLMFETLREEVDEKVRGTTSVKSKVLWTVAGLALLVWLVWSAWSAFQRERLEDRVTERFNSEPGYLLTGHEFAAGQLQLSGLRDPLSTPPAAVLESAAIPAEEVAFVFKPYQSLEPEMVVLQLTSGLRLNQDVSLTLSGSALNVQGPLTSAQYLGLENLPGAHPVVRSVSLEGSRLAEDEAIALISSELAVPRTVSIVASGGRMVLSGTADADWYVKALAGPDLVGGWPLDFAPLTAALRSQFDGLTARVDGQEIMFERAYDIRAESVSILKSLARDLAELQALAAALDLSVPIRLEGHADGVGTAEKNREVALNRARAVLEALRAEGVSPVGIAITQGAWESGVEDNSRREVVVRAGGEAAR